MPLCFAHVVSTCGLPHCPQVPPKTCLLAVFFGGIGGRRVFCDDFFSSSNISSDFFSSELYSDSQRKHKSQRGVKNLLVSVVLFGVCGFFATNTKGTGKKKDTQRIMSLSWCEVWQKNRHWKAKTLPLEDWETGGGIGFSLGPKRIFQKRQHQKRVATFWPRG